MKKIYESEKFPIYVCMIIYTIIHLFMIKGIDDLFFSTACESINLFEFIAQRYQTWTSRIIIEGILVILCQYLPMIIWKALNIGMYYLMIYSISELIIEKDKRIFNTIMCIFLLVIPIDIFKEAGWMATMNNYLWVAATGIYSLTLLKKILENKKLTFLQIVSYILAIIYASNQEQMAGILFILYTFFGIFYIAKNKRVKPILIINYTIIVLQIIVVLTCPGNLNRKIQEEAHWYPGFSDLSILEKLTNGFLSMMDYVIESGRIIFFSLIIFITYTVFKKYKSNIYRVISSIPLFLVIITKYCIRILNEPSHIYLIQDSQIYLYAKLILYILILLFMTLGIWIISKDNNSKLINVFIIYFTGFISRLIIAFSPTVYASGERTSIFWYISFIIIIILTIQEIYEEKEITKNGKIQKNRYIN